MTRLLWGIDLGGTKIEGVVVSAGKPTTPLARHRIATEASLGYQHILAQIAKVVEELSHQVRAKPELVGIGTPGTVDPNRQTLKNSNTQCLNGKPLPADLSQVLKVPLRISNDANCFALAEARAGAGRGGRVVFGVILGTGVGGGVVVHGSAWSGKQGNAGEWGHNVLEPSGLPCYCGKSGCVERVLSGPALEEWYRSQGGEQRALPEILMRAQRGDDALAAATVNRLCQCFGKAIAVVINILDPDVIVLGGGVSNVPQLYTDGRAAAAQYVFNDRFDTAIVKHELGDSAGVFGAAALCIDANSNERP